MSTLLLVRHAQASFLEDDYDRLSAQGEIQAAKLGEYLASTGITIDEVITGPRRRHQHTADLVGGAMQRAGLNWPVPISLPEWDEHQVDRLMGEHAARLAVEHPPLKRLIEESQVSASPPERARRFQRLFEAIAERWLSETAGHPEIETWKAFRTRVLAGLNAIVTRPGRGRRVAVFTSVGAVTVALQRAMGCDDETALATGWRVWNSSVTEFVFAGSRFTLDRFNALPHLPNPMDWTYR
ncbi:MAG: histidine phosphatase family protein [Planctomycetaceae bacterium]|nr:histidine phosphatase family protein [Planctomycetaceae bacterium]